MGPRGGSPVVRWAPGAASRAAPGGVGEVAATPRRPRLPSRIEFARVTPETDGGPSHVVAVTSRQEPEMTNERAGTHTSASAQEVRTVRRPERRGEGGGGREGERDA